MFWVTRVMAPLALVAGIVATSTVLITDAAAQPPFGKGGFQPPFGKGQRGKDDKKVEKKVEEKKVERQPGDRRGPAPRNDAAVDAWLKVLLEKITDPHDVIRDSARGAIVGVGPPAIPALQRLAEGNDAAKAVAAQKLIAAIQQRGPGQQAGAGQGGPGGPDRGGRGAGGMGGFGRGQGGNPMGPMGPGGMGPGGRGGPPGMNPFDRGGERGGPGAGPMGPMGFGGDPNAMLGRIIGELKLSETQQKAMQETLEGHAKRIREFAEKARAGKVERQEMAETMEKLQKELIGNIKKVLTEDQFKKFQERLPEGRVPMPGFGGSGGERGRGFGGFGPGGFGGDGGPEGNRGRGFGGFGSGGFGGRGRGESNEPAPMPREKR